VLLCSDFLSSLFTTVDHNVLQEGGLFFNGRLFGQNERTVAVFQKKVE
jgi:hypothetical protein